MGVVPQRDTTHFSGIFGQVKQEREHIAPPLLRATVVLPQAGVVIVDAPLLHRDCTLLWKWKRGWGGGGEGWEGRKSYTTCSGRMKHEGIPDNITSGGGGGGGGEEEGKRKYPSQVAD